MSETKIVISAYFQKALSRVVAVRDLFHIATLHVNYAQWYFDSSNNYYYVLQAYLEREFWSASYSGPSLFVDALYWMLLALLLVARFGNEC